MDANFPDSPWGAQTLRELLDCLKRNGPRTLVYDGPVRRYAFDGSELFSRIETACLAAGDGFTAAGVERLFAKVAFSSGRMLPDMLDLDLDAATAALDAADSEKRFQAAAAASVPEPNGEPVTILASWGEILAALKMKKQDREKVSRLNRTRGGPIKIGKKGQQPLVDRAKLREWWDRLTIEYEVGDNRARDAKPTTAIAHQHGRDGIVIPDIGGNERKRRADRKP